ncbi:hypothetical protein LRC484719_44400 [Mycobacterium riyadhense]
MPTHPVDKEHGHSIGVTDPIGQLQPVDRAWNPEQRGCGGQHIADRTGHDRQSGTDLRVCEPRLTSAVEGSEKCCV